MTEHITPAEPARTGEAPQRSLLDRVEPWLLDRKKATYGVAVLRIGFGLILGVSLLADFRHRHLAWGAGRDWAQPRVDTDSWWPIFDHLFGAGMPAWQFNVQYLALTALSILMVLGWRSRVVIPMVLVGYIGLTRANPFISDGGLHLFRIALVYLCLIDTSKRWSLDAWYRARRPAPARRSLVPAWLENLLHNTGVVLLAFQVCLVYVASAMFKIQGNLWQEGTAVYYVLQLDEFATWPQITGLLDTRGLFIGVMTYLTVFVQLFFPFLLLQRTTRIVGLIVVTAMHLGIGLFMGLLHFSLTMIAIDAIFIRDVSYQAAFMRVQPLLDRARSALRLPARQPDRTSTPAPHEPRDEPKVPDEAQPS